MILFYKLHMKGYRKMTSFALKTIALISMLFDHFGDAFFKHFSYMNLIGRFAFPIFAFQISEGFTHTKNIKKYFIRLGLFAIISQIPFMLFSNKFLGNSLLSLNIFFTLFLGLLSIYLYDYIIKIFKNQKYKFPIDKLFGIVIVILISFIAEILNTDYGMWGVLVVFSFYIFKSKKYLMIISFILLCSIKYIFRFIITNFNYSQLALGIFTIFPIIFISLYNGMQGRKIKYFLYLFYPIHLLILYLIF